jgi:hypothetical protein
VAYKAKFWYACGLTNDFNTPTYQVAVVERLTQPIMKCPCGNSRLLSLLYPS